jgi:CRP/FNR family transcriptional regulator, cyclic AMP receptor protein
MQLEHARRKFDLSGLLISTGTPFTVLSDQPETVLFCQGDPCDSVMYIEEGRVWLKVTSPDGQEVICGLMGPGAFLGDEALSGHAVWSHTATSMSPTKVLVIPKAPMITLLHTQRALSDRFIAYTLRRRAHLEADLLDQLLNPAERRLARALVVLAGCDAGRPCPCVLPSVSQATIAEMVGTTRSRVNTFLGKFKRRACIEERDGLLYVTPRLVEVVGNGDGHVSNDTSSAMAHRLR